MVFRFGTIFFRSIILRQFFQLASLIPQILTRCLHAAFLTER